jgi:hypothetical protein
MTPIGRNWLAWVRPKIGEPTYYLLVIAVPSLCKKYPKAKQESIASQKAFRELTDNTDRALTKVWLKSSRDAQAKRITRPDVMLIYEVKLEKGITVLVICNEC